MKMNGLITKVIRLIDCNNPLARRTPIEKILSDEMYATFVPVEDAKLDGCLKSIVAPTLPDREGYHKVRLGDFVSRIPRKVYDLSQIEDEQRVLAYIVTDGQTSRKVVVK